MKPIPAAPRTFNPITDAYYTEAEVVTMFKRSKTWLHLTRKAGKIWGRPAPLFAKVGDKVFYSKQSVDDFFQFDLARSYDELENLKRRAKQENTQG